MNSFLTAYQFEDFISHNLEEFSRPYPLLNSLIVPRPIALITSVGENGVVNAAPFSYFNAICKQPALVSVSIEQRLGEKKDTARNIRRSKEFVINVCSIGMQHALEITAKDCPSEVSEIGLANLSLLPSRQVSIPRIANTLIQLECRLREVIDLEGGKIDLVIGEIVEVHLHKKVLDSKGYIDFAKLEPLARLSGNSYAGITDILAQ